MCIQIQYVCTHIQLCSIVTSTFFTYTRCFMNHSLGWSCGFVAVNEERFEDESKESSTCPH